MRRHSRERRATVATYSAGLRAFVRFLARRALLPPGVTYEQMRENVREVMSRASYKTPRIDRRLPLLVTHVLGLPLPPLHGHSLLPLLRGGAPAPRAYACAGLQRGESLEWALHTPQWSYLLPLSQPAENLDAPVRGEVDRAGAFPSLRLVLGDHRPLPVELEVPGFEAWKSSRSPSMYTPKE